jgi:predicted RNase H-like HicB family nuclease
MPIKLSEIIPLGRRADEYIGMFGLSEQDLRRKILDCGGGPSSFNAEMNALGSHVASVDPLYEFSKEEIQAKIDATFDDIMAQAEKNRESYVWEAIKSPAELRKRRKSAMEIFLEDYERGRREKRYIPGELPHLSFKDKEFDIALSSHFLLLFSHILSLDFHIEAIFEMLRVASEVRIFPLQDFNVAKSPYVDAIIEKFSDKHDVDIVRVGYEFQKGSNEYLRIR